MEHTVTIFQSITSILESTHLMKNFNFQQSDHQMFNDDLKSQMRTNKNRKSCLSNPHLHTVQTKPFSVLLHSCCFYRIIDSIYGIKFNPYFKFPLIRYFSNSSKTKTYFQLTTLEHTSTTISLKFSCGTCQTAEASCKNCSKTSGTKAIARVFR